MSTKDYAKRHRELGLCRNCSRPTVEGSRIFCNYHREKDRIRRRNTEKKIAIRLKDECLKHYGEKCLCCGEQNKRFLTLEHEERNGNNHRKRLFKHNVGGVHMYRWLKENRFPKGHTILCMNCNWATRYGEICPHKV